MPSVYLKIDKVSEQYVNVGQIAKPFGKETLWPVICAHNSMRQTILISFNSQHLT